MPLFDRSRNGMSPTEPGEMFSRRVGRTLAYISTGTREAVRLDRQTNSHRPGRGFIDVDRLLTTAQLAGQGVLVAGGTGGLGYRLGLWLLRQGAARVLLTGRSGRLAEQEDPAGALPASLEIHRLDICDEDAVAAFLAEQRDHPVPIRGVFQAAMVLRDQTLRQLDRETFRAVLAPKVRGAEILDRLTREMDLRCFVLFSSVASALGNAGQAAYVVANRAMENLARRRAEAGLPALAVQLGAISDTGVIERTEGLRQVLESQGIGTLTSTEAFERLDAELRQPSHTVLGIYRTLDRAKPGSGEATALLVELRNLSGEERTQRLADLGVEILARVLKRDAEELPVTSTLRDLGVDSLFVVEITLEYELALSVRVPPSLFMGQLSIGQIAGEIAGMIDPA